MLDAGKVDAAALPHAERILESLVGGHREGHEWKAARKAAGGPGDSLAFNLTTGQWAHFGGDGKGPGLVSFYAYVKASPIPDACTAVAGMVGYTNGAAGPPQTDARRPPKPPDDAPAETVPTSAGLPGPHPRHGEPTATYRYVNAAGELLFVVARYDVPDGNPDGKPQGKEFCPWTWRRSKWTAKAYPAPRPLYGLQDALRRPEAPVLVVEGEKCADIANAVLPAYAAVTWAGGANAVRTADWSPLAGRVVDVWPDADKPGLAAAAQLAALLVASGCRVRVLTVDGKPEGWDIGNAVAERVLKATMAAEQWRAITEPAKDAKPAKVAKEVAQAIATDLERPSASLIWQRANITGSGLANDGGIPHATASNIAAIIRTSIAFGREIWHDDFRHRIYCTENGVSRPWIDADDLLALQFAQQVALLPKAGLQTVVQAVQLVAVENRRNSVHDYLRSLTWDGTPRLEHWTIDYLGTPGTAYTRAVARNWLISMVARAMRPGCQADHMPVLEGLSGRGKSSALAILGGDWYVAAPQAFGSKEFLEAIQGAWLIEIPDMVGFGKREHTQIISAITTRTDRYRAAYGRAAQDHPRVCVFAATSETSDYLQDSRGIRRYWPLTCTDINLEGLSSTRDQLFAEAAQAFASGADWHLTPHDETADEQAKRKRDDPWMDRITEFMHAREATTIRTVFEDCLFVLAQQQDRGAEMRVANCLKQLGYLSKPERVNGVLKRVYRKS